MKRMNVDTLSLDELWTLHDEISAVLTAKLTAEKRLLERRLAKLSSGVGTGLNSERPHHSSANGRARRPYPVVHPKYRNPADPSETWAGRGKQPRWLIAQLKSGKRIENFLIEQTGRRAQRKQIAR